VDLRKKMGAANKLWISGEIQDDVADSFRDARVAVEKKVNPLIEGTSLGAKTTEWAFIAIIRKEEHPYYNEVVKRSSRGKALEFRLKISHGEFASANPREQIHLLLRALGRSVTMMGKLDVPAETQSALKAVLSQAAADLVGPSPLIQ
jgi:Immunity protein 44